MNESKLTVRALAAKINIALAVLGFATPLKALTITQQASAVGGSATSHTAGAFDLQWNAAQFSPQNGALSAVTISATMTATVSTYEVNQFFGPVMYQPRVWSMGLICTSDGWIFCDEAGNVTGAAAMLTPGQASSVFVGTVVNDPSVTLTGNALAQFIGDGAVKLNFLDRYDGNTMYGVASGGGSIAAILTYDYAPPSVPESHASGPLLLCALALVGGVHRWVTAKSIRR